ncbi:MAG TPA: phosphoribosylanthranilate isomerase [Hypericibacter adhaerens]|jgi:phosphoribosylanthranilate isomerase|nr:phosphoribosylanthranilate isomerase [Hypericibacter adhaerens]HWA41806.1 phosphoribosylanthranilate isomerase [Hypericibacter adhaerens]
MAIEVKICGINSPAALSAAVEGGAALVGFNFYRKSPRFVTPEAAAALARTVPASIKRVAVIVDLDNEAIAALLAAVPLDMLQLHGKEDPTRAAAIRARFRKPVMKAISIAQASDLEAADKFLPVVDRLMFDAKPPPSMKDALPGGNAISFDWTLLAGRDWPKPWMLAGGLNPENLAEAVRISGARRVDAASGVEDRPGVKSPEKIRALLALAKTL